MPPSQRTRKGGVRKLQQKRDRDGDISMGAAPSLGAPTRGGRGNRGGNRTAGNKNNGTATPGFTELKVTGWSDTKEMSKLLGFLERHSSRRSPNVAKNGVPPKMVKRHRITDTTLTIWVRPEDVTAFNKINGFTFASEHGSQKLTIAGPGIRSKSPTSMDTDKDNKEKPNEVAEMLKGFLNRRYNVEDKLLDLSTVGGDQEVAKSGLFDSAKTGSKFFPALMKICDQVLRLASLDKKEVIYSVDLSGNNLQNADMIKSLATTLPHIRNLNLAGNNFTGIKDVKAFKNRFRFLEHLIIEIAEIGWEDEIVSWFPKLRILNDKQVRPDPPATNDAAKSSNAPASIPIMAPAPVVDPTPAMPSVPTPAPGLAAPGLTGPGLTGEQDAMVMYVMNETNLKRSLSVELLQASNWDIEAAARLFMEKKDSLPADSFMGEEL